MNPLKISPYFKRKFSKLGLHQDIVQYKKNNVTGFISEQYCYSKPISKSSKFYYSYCTQFEYLVLNNTLIFRVIEYNLSLNSKQVRNVSYEIGKAHNLSEICTLIVNHRKDRLTPKNKWIPNKYFTYNKKSDTILA